MKWISRRPTTSRHLNDKEKHSAAIVMDEIMKKTDRYHPSLVLKMDETFASWCSTNEFTYAQRGSKRVM